MQTSKLLKTAGQRRGGSVGGSDLGRLNRPAFFYWQIMKHSPFQSNYRPDFELVEQREGNRRLFPHTDQLPHLSRAISFEFYRPLPDRFARVDHRADGFHNIVLHTAAMMFCSCVNGARPDGLHLYYLPDASLVTKVAVVQQITESTRLGSLHSFRFYSGTEFFSGNPSFRQAIAVHGPCTATVFHAGAGELG
jgi:hypothetical protein